MSTISIAINEENENILMDFDNITLVDMEALELALLKIKDFLTEEQILELRNNYQFDILPLCIGSARPSEDN